VSTIINPYAPPQAEVVAVVASGKPEDFQKVKLLSGRGRIGRLRFVVHIVGAFVVYGVLTKLLFAPFDWALSQPTRGNISLIVFVLWQVFCVLKTVQRSHDMDWTGWATPMAWVVPVGLLWVFKPGSAGLNRFGAPPPPNTLGIRILAWLSPLLVMVVGIFSALPG